MPFDVSVIPPITHYDQIAQARDIETAVGEENMRAAYFLGHTELLGLGAAYSPAAATRGDAYVVPATGVTNVTDVATATGADAAAIGSANGIGAADPVTPGQQLSVPGIHIHTVREGGTETKAEIARLNGVSEADLDRANVGFNWATLAPGQAITPSSSPGSSPRSPERSRTCWRPWARPTPSSIPRSATTPTPTSGSTRAAG